MTHKLITLLAVCGLLCAGFSAAGSVAAQTSAYPDSSQQAPPCDEDGCAQQPVNPALSGPTPAAADQRNPGAPQPRTNRGVPGTAAAPGAVITESITTTRPVSDAADLLTSRTSVRSPGPLRTRSDFERFAEDAAGRVLPVYGRQLFGDVPTTFAPIDHIPVPADYVLGPGDQLVIRVWGKIDLETVVTVDRNGQIYLPKVGTFSVAGLRYQQIEGFLSSAIGNLYKGFELNVTMGQLRSIQVFVLGSARRPGVYTVSSLSTLVNALFASGGPSATGSMRDVQLRRGNQLVTEFDIYDLLRNGDKSHDVQLLPGDVIYIPSVGPQVAITGSVNEPGIYELKGQTTIASALKGAGGMTSLAGTDRVLLERVEDHRRRRVDDFPLDEAALQRGLHDGDILQVFPISPKFENAVTLRGSVATPGRFPWHEGQRVSDLIPSRDFLVRRSYWRQQNHLAGNVSAEMIADLAGGRNQSNLVAGNMNAGATTDAGGYGNQPNMPAGNVSAGMMTNAAGYGTRPNSAPGNADTDAADEASDYSQLSRPTANAPINMMADLSEHSAEINWDYAAIERLDHNDLSTRLIAFDLGNAIDNPASADNQLLKAGDVITIFSRRDIALPEDRHAAFVSLSGEVNAPGVYRIQPGETLRSIVLRAGGLTQHSYLYASQLTRVSTRVAEEEQLRVSLNQMQRELMSRYAAAPSISPTNPQEQQAQLSAQQAVIAQFSAVRPTGRIVLDMKPTASTLEDIPTFRLEDGDSFYIPPRLSTVQVAGTVYNANAFRYQQGKHLSAYLRDAGGATRQADTKRILLIRADGTVISKQGQGGFWREGFDNLTLLPGDAIVVPTKLKSPNSFAQQLPFLSLILSQAAMTGAVIGTAY